MLVIGFIRLEKFHILNGVQADRGDPAVFFLRDTDVPAAGLGAGKDLERGNGLGLRPACFGALYGDEDLAFLLYGGQDGKKNLIFQGMDQVIAAALDAAEREV